MGRVALVDGAARAAKHFREWGEARSQHPNFNANLEGDLDAEAERVFTMFGRGPAVRQVVAQVKQFGRLRPRS